MFSLVNKVAVVTGASQGIGENIANTLASAGAHVVCLARSEEKLIVLASKINKLGGNATPYKCDISDGEAFSDAIRNITKKFKKLDILVNNAGITSDSLIMRMRKEQWHSVIQTNLDANYYGIKSAIKPMMKNKFGRIINITSIVGLTGNIGQANYAASKSGLIGMTKSIAKEVGSRGITANCIAPGWIDTDMTSDIPENSKNELLNKIPVKKIGKPEDIAYAVLFLASDEAGYITGQTITIDGGRVIN